MRFKNYWEGGCRMNEKAFELILKTGESFFVEFKERLDKSLAKEIVAFSNSQGGRIFIGVKDNGEIKGMRITNKIVVFNPGGLVKWLKPEEFGSISKTRNPIIASLLSRKELLTLLENKVGSKLVETVGSKLVENQLKIVLLILEDEKITKNRMSEILNIRNTAVDKNILKLKNLGINKRVGPAKGGHWEVIE